MALGENRWFQWKSKKQQEKEARQYAAWAFPHGDLQRDNLTTLMTGLRPKDSPQITLASYLTCKELYENTLGDSESREEAIDRMINEVRSYNQLIKREDMSLFLAVVLADADIDERCEYPSVDDIQAKIQELNEIKKGRKKGKIKGLKNNG
jgi:hypothetical protein